MGYTTDFSGELELNPPLSPEQVTYLQTLNMTRRMKRDVNLLRDMPDPKRIAVGLPLGVDGEFYVGSEDDYGQRRDASILEYNDPPQTQPSLWLGWTVTEDGHRLEWDGGEKFYDYVEWLEYIVENFLVPWGIIANGEIEWQGEDRDDLGKIIVSNNFIETKRGRIVYGED